jgi:kynureninase
MTTSAAATAFDSSETGAHALDDADPLARFRARFALPLAPDGSTASYLCGHSLGAAPRAAREIVLQELSDWERLGVLGHEQAARGWVGYAELLQVDLAMLAGALPHEVVAMNSLSVNLHLLLASFYRPTARRHQILIERGAFSSDRHVVASQLRWHGRDPAASLLELAPRDGADLLQQTDIEAAIDAAGDRLALVLLPGVQYRTGQLFNLARITALAHDVGAAVLVDLAHAIGNVPLSLHAWLVDGAAWCSYKYLNGGPGAIGGLYIHEQQARNARLPRLEGWWGHAAATRFAMAPEFEAGPGAAAWQISNPPILSAAPLLASLAEFRAAGMPALRAKSLQLTAYLRYLLQALCGERLAVLTGADDDVHGAQLSVRVRANRNSARAVFGALLPRGVVADWREPDIIRLAPVPLYNSFHDVWRAARTLHACLAGS